MTTTERIYQHLQAMPLNLQDEVLNFIEFLQYKKEVSASGGNQKTQKLQQIMQKIADNDGFAKITDPEQWQVQQRKDRLQPR